MMNVQPVSAPNYSTNINYEKFLSENTPIYRTTCPRITNRSMITPILQTNTNL